MRSIAADRGFGFLPAGFSGSVAGSLVGSWVGGVSTELDITAGGGGAESGISFYIVKYNWTQIMELRNLRIKFDSSLRIVWKK